MARSLPRAPPRRGLAAAELAIHWSHRRILAADPPADREPPAMTVERPAAGACRASPAGSASAPGMRSSNTMPQRVQHISPRSSSCMVSGDRHAVQDVVASMRGGMSVP